MARLRLTLVTKDAQKSEDMLDLEEGQRDSQVNINVDGINLERWYKAKEQKGAAGTFIEESEGERFINEDRLADDEIETNLEKKQELKYETVIRSHR